MRCERLPAAPPEMVRALLPAPESVEADVRDIVERVRREGDPAVADYTKRFDTGGEDPPPLAVSRTAREEALEVLDPALRRALYGAARNIRTVAEALVGGEREVELPQGHRVTVREEPVRRVGAYVPGGRAPYPSTVLMTVVAARVAGVERVAVCTPPGPGGEIDPTLLAACAVAGADEVYRMGGAQAIAAFAYGTQSVPAVDLIVGPGNAYVTEAKRQVYGRVGIDGLAGPSDVLIVASGDARPGEVALDLAAQAEHGPGTLVVAVSPDGALLEAVAERLAREPDTGAVAVLVETIDLRDALAFATGFAPEHLQLLGDEAEMLAPRVRGAGAVFIGTGTAFGDYVAGSNHVLPTGGAARFSSGLTPAAFRRQVAEVRVPPLAAAALASLGAPLARAEGFEAHARSMEARMGEQ